MRAVLYTKRIEDMIAFYGTHFGYRAVTVPEDRIIELHPPDASLILMLHPTAKSQKEGQVLVKLVFTEPDVPAAKARLEAAGVPVGPVLDGGGYRFANLKDPSKNALQISERPLSGQ